jgi:hypothetical protein
MSSRGLDAKQAPRSLAKDPRVGILATVLSPDALYLVELEQLFHHRARSLCRLGSRRRTALTGANIKKFCIAAFFC